MKKFFIFFAALGSLLLPKEGLGLCLDAANDARDELIRLIEEKDSGARAFYDEWFKRPIDCPIKDAYDINIYHRYERGDRPEWLNLLTAAIFFDNKEAFDWLLPDADPLAENELGETPLNYAYRSPNKYYFQELAKTKDVRGAMAQIAQLNSAIKNKDILEVARIIDTGVNVNIPDQLGNFPIHYAALTGLPNIIEPLLQKKANINAQDNNGDTPLHLLIGEYIKTENKNLSEIILGFAFGDLGASLTISNKVGEIPLTMFKFEETVKELFDAGSINQQQFDEANK